MNLILRNKLIQAVEQVLHVPGNYAGGILEMAMVFDLSLPIEKHKQIAAEIAKILKGHSEVFRNVWLNAILWDGKEMPYCESVPLTVMMLQGYPKGDSVAGGRKATSTEDPKELAGLLDYLKRFQARSKLIFLITDTHFLIEETPVREAMKPFLEKKLIVLTTESYQGDFAFRHLLEYKPEEV